MKSSSDGHSRPAGRAGGLSHRAYAAASDPGRWLAALAVVCFVWAGMVLGISFLEAPVKFQAPSLTLPVGLDVGRHVFAAFSKVELGWALLVLLLAVRSRPERAVRVSLAVVLVVVGVQALWLLPVLDARVEVFLAGGRPRPSPHHLIYIALEGLKLVGLAFTGIRCLGAVTRRAGRARPAPHPHRGAPRAGSCQAEALKHLLPNDFSLRN